MTRLTSFSERVHACVSHRARACVVSKRSYIFQYPGLARVLLTLSLFHVLMLMRPITHYVIVSHLDFDFCFSLRTPGL